MVPNCLLLNIYNLLKLKNGFRASTALKIDPMEGEGDSHIIVTGVIVLPLRG